MEIHDNTSSDFNMKSKFLTDLFLAYIFIYFIFGRRLISPYGKLVND